MIKYKDYISNSGTTRNENLIHFWRAPNPQLEISIVQKCPHDRVNLLIHDSIHLKKKRPLFGQNIFLLSLLLFPFTLGSHWSKDLKMHVLN